MRFTDIFIKRPVLASVISLLILVLGIRSIFLLPVRQFPFTQNAVVTISTIYTGADPEVIAGFITTPLEHSIAEASGIDYLTSSSSNNVSTIQAVLRLNYDPGAALTEINTKVNATLDQLPKDSQRPVLTVAIGETIDSMYIGFYSQVLPSNKITDYIMRVVQPKLQAIEGVHQAEILGKRLFAMRAWLDPVKMAAYKLTGTDVANALANNDFISAAGRTDGDMLTINISPETGLHTPEEFKELIIKTKSDAIVRLGDVATVTLGSEDYDTAVSFDGLSAVYVGIKVAPAANLLTVMDKVRQNFPTIQAQLPQGLEAKIVYDATKYVISAIHEVNSSLLEALAIVTLIVFLFLGSVRSVIIPMIAIPLSLIGACFIMLVLGYSINLLTLLALVLSIGLVVDDAIIIVENVHRHMENGMSRFDAAIQGTRELANPIIAISIVLIAVYIPIGFMSGLTGALFTEFAFTLAGAVGVSAIIALTLSPMMCSKLLRSPQQENKPESKFVQFIDHQFNRITDRYQTALHLCLDSLPVVCVFAIIVFISIYFLYSTAQSELAPQEDQGIVISQITTAPNATLRQTLLYSKEIYQIFNQIPEKDHIFQLEGLSGLNSGFSGIVFKPWNERTRTANELQALIQPQFTNITGGKVVAFQPPPLPGTSGLPIQLIINTTEPYSALNEVTENIMKKIEKSGLFAYLDSDLKLDKAQANIIIDRDKVAQLGLTMRDVGNALSYNVGGNYINYFNLAGRSYKIIPQVARTDRLNPQQVLEYYITSKNGTAIPFASFASIKMLTVPETLNHFQQLNSATISGVPMQGVTLGEALDKITAITSQAIPSGYYIDYAGPSRQFFQEKSTFVPTFLFAFIIIFLTLAALFESYQDPLIILISVPMSICGALIFVSLGVGAASLNIYTEVGLVTLIGLISKHGILIVQFAKDLQKEGKSKREAIQMAAGIRLRPILMTTASMVFGVFPLLLAKGAGAASRFDIGLVIASGISIGTFFTLFVVPAMYLILGQENSAINPSENIG